MEIFILCCGSENRADVIKLRLIWSIFGTEAQPAGNKPSPILNFCGSREGIYLLSALVSVLILFKAWMWRTLNFSSVIITAEITSCPLHPPIQFVLSHIFQNASLLSALCVPVLFYQLSVKCNFCLWKSLYCFANHWDVSLFGHKHDNGKQIKAMRRWRTCLQLFLVNQQILLPSL